jgi:serine protease AprX
MKEFIRFCNALIIVFLLLSLAGPASPPAFVAAQKVQPALVQAAQAVPEQTVRVIVQRAGTASGLEGRLENLGGKLVQDLRMINAFAAELPASAVLKLAKFPGVRFISLDGKMERSAFFTPVTVADSFPTSSYSGSTGTQSWLGSWVEGGENDGVWSGRIRVGLSRQCASGACLLFGGNGVYINGLSLSRPANLAGANHAVLTFNYRRNWSGSNSASVSVQISGNGGASWTTLATYFMEADDLNQVSQMFDVTNYVSANTMLRFQGSGRVDGSFYFDNIQFGFDYPATANYYLGTTGADALQFEGLTGQDVTVAVVDSGISATNDLAGRVTLAPNYAGLDDFGHGTHVAGIVGGNGATLKTFRGVAQGVNLISLDVTDNLGMTYESTVIGALQWVYDHKVQYNIRVVNLSLNSTVELSYHQSPLDAACEILWFNGLVVVASAGNKGPAGGYNTTMTSPANDPFIITVGASDEHDNTNPADDTVAPFSSHGITQDGFVKPDILAPGYNVVNLLSPNSSWAVEHPDRVVESYFIRLSGTSMAAPMVSGAVALLLQDEPNLTPDQVKYRLLNTGRSISGDEGVFPYLDMVAAVKGNSTASANLGLTASQMLTTGSDPITWGSVGWNSVGWNSVGWNSVGWNSVGWNSVGWNSTVEVDGVFWGPTRGGKNK